MQTPVIRLRMAALLALILLATSPANLARAQQPEMASQNQQTIRLNTGRSELELIEKFSKDLETKDRIKRVDGFDPAVVEVTAITPNRIRLEAKTQGVTTVVVIDEFDNTSLVDIFVKGDARHLQAIINSKFADSSVEAFKVRESVVLRGWVTQPEHITQIVNIAEQFHPRVLNQMRVGGVQQVLLKVKVMEVQRSKIRNMGFNFLYLNRNGYMSSTPGQLTQLGELELPFGSGPAATFNNNTLNAASLAFGFINDSNIFQAFFDALKEEALLKILAEPELVTTNGRPANLLSGGEFPILVPQSLGTVTIEWREFGVRLEAVPIILGNGRLRLELQPEVSERDFTNSVSVGGTTVPGLTTRRVNTQVEMRFGQSLIIAGLIANRRTAETSKVPFLGELPLIGAAFRRVRYDDVETELVVLVTPELVAPLDPSQVPMGGPGLFTDTPTDRELFRDGMIEVPNYNYPCEDCDLPLPNGMPAGQHRHIPGLIDMKQPSVKVLEDSVTTESLVPPVPAGEVSAPDARNPSVERLPEPVAPLGPNTALPPTRPLRSPPQGSVRVDDAPPLFLESVSPPSTSQKTPAVIPDPETDDQILQQSWRRTRPGLIEPKPKRLPVPPPST